jgi:hypothetical protein
MVLEGQVLLDALTPALSEFSSNLVERNDDRKQLVPGFVIVSDDDDGRGSSLALSPDVYLHLPHQSRRVVSFFQRAEEHQTCGREVFVGRRDALKPENL